MSTNTEHEHEYIPLEGSVTIDQIIHAYVDSLLDDHPMSNPMFESLVHVKNHGWLHVKFSVDHTWSAEVPEAGRKAMEEAGIQYPKDETIN